jgi:uncharacterized protein (TIGR02271 family)
MIRQEDLGDLTGAEVYDDTGARIGSVGQIYLHPRDDEPLWVTVRTGSLDFQESFVPLRGARFGQGRLTVAVSGDRVRHAPLVDTGGPLEQADAERLSSYYGPGPAGDAMTRSEERLVAGTRSEPVTKVRLRKYLVTEQRQVTVPVTREEVRLEEVPISPDEAPSAPDEDERDAAMTLHAERPVVSTETVPVERVRLTKETVRGEETVTHPVRKERIDYEGPEENS